MAKARNRKNAQAKGSDTLKMLSLPTCTVVLHNIALDKNLVQLYQLCFTERRKEDLKHSSSCINATKNTSNAWTLKEDVTVAKTVRITRNRLRRLSEMKNEECKNLKSLNNISCPKILRSGFVLQEQQSKCDTSVKSFSNSTDETSSISSNTQEKTKKKLTNNERPRIQRRKRSKKKLYTFDSSDTSLESVKINSGNENCLDEKTLTAIDYNSKMQETLNEIQSVKVPWMKSDTKYNIIKKYINNNNLYKTDVTNGTVCHLNLEQCEMNQNIKDNTIQAHVSESNFTNSSFVLKSKNCLSNNLSETNHVTKTVPGFVTTYTEKQHANETNKKTIQKDLPKITGNHILPKGSIKIMKVNASDESLQNNLPKQVSYIDNTLESTNILREKEYHTSEINKSLDMLKISESTSTLNNNINLKNKNIDKVHNAKMDHINDFLMEINNIHNNENANDAESGTTSEECTSNYQEQSNELDNNEEHKSDILQDDKKYDKTNSDKTILNKNTSNFMNVSENCNVNRSLILVSKEEIIKQNRKRIIEENIDIKSDNKKKKLNRIHWQDNVTYTKALNHQQFNNFSNIDTMITIESDITKESNSRRQSDLREHLNKIRLTQSPKLLTSENKFNDTNSVESEQIDLNNENDKITSITIKNEEFHKKLSVDKEPAFSETLYKEKEIHTDPVCNNNVQCHNMLQSILEETQHTNQIDKNIYEDTNVQKKCTNGNEDDNNDNDDDDDCISLFAESFDTTLCENTFLSEQNKSNKSLHSDVPYIMTTSSFNKYVKQNVTEFNKEYAKYEESIKISNETDETKRDINNQSRQTAHTNYVPETKIASKTLPYEKNVEILKNQWLRNSIIGCNINNIMKFIHGYCFGVLRKGICYKPQCRYKGNLQDLIDTICLEDPKTIINIMHDALSLSYIFFCRMIYIKLLQKLTVDQILIMYQMFHDVRILKEDLVLLKQYITQNTLSEFLNRQISLKKIVNYLVEYIPPTNNSSDLMNILICVERSIKPGEYWDTLRSVILRLPPNKRIIQKILDECVENKKFTDIQDVNNNVINQLSPTLISIFDKDIVQRFRNLLNEKTENNSRPVELIQNFGEKLSNTIASPDGNTNLSEVEPPECSNTFINKNPNENSNITEVSGESYTLRLIGDLPDAQSIYRDHEQLWKFYVDLDRFKKGLIHHDYNYVIDILKEYTEKQDETPLFVRSCCNILRTEIKRSEYHLTNIIRRTVQMDNFNVLGKILFDMGLDILNNLVDKEAWGLALQFIQSLHLIDFNLPHNAEYFLLSAEIYLANKQAIKAYELLKCQNIIYTSRDKWYVTSTINDEYVRSKIMHILLDSFCNEFIEYAFFLFQFLLRDQCSQYYPIDLSCYVDKFIILFLSKKDMNLTKEMANLILKYTFTLSTTTCRALVSTLIHLDENLARQIYKYAEGLGIYSTVKVWPITYIIINNDLTEEEIYLIFLQLLKNLVINFGHAIEFAHQIKVYIILEIKLTKRFYCAELQNYYNNKAITNIKILIRNVLKKRFDPPILLMRGSKGRIYKLQSKSLINYLKAEHCN